MPRKKDSSQSEWSYSDWYEKNKEVLAEKRRLKYHSDKEHRQKLLDQNRDYRQRIISERPPPPKTKVRIPKRRRPVSLKVKIKGKNVLTQLVHVGAFARAIGRSVPTIHQWERVGLLPRTPYELSHKKKPDERLYTAAMVGVVKDVLSRRGPMIYSKDPTFRKEILDGWRKAGTIVKE